MSIDPRRDPWRRLMGYPGETPVAPAAKRPNPWEQLMAGRTPAAGAAPIGAGTPQQMPTYDERLARQAQGATQAPAVAAQMANPRLARFRALVQAGAIDPNNILGADGRIRPDVYALLDQQPGYRGVAPAGYEDYGGGATEWRNPAEVGEAQWERTFQAGREEANVGRSGMYFDPATQQNRVTAAYGGQLLDRFANARGAEERYRAQVLQAQQAPIGPQAAYENAMERQQEVARQQVPGRANTIDEARLAAANRAVQQAQMAYNRSRGVGRDLRGNAPTSLEQLGQGMTAEQLTAAGLAAGEGYSAQEQEEIASGRAAKTARTKPYEDYLRAARGRGVI